MIQYNGWAEPIIILTTLPLALIGALSGRYFTGNALGVMPQLRRVVEPSAHPPHADLSR